MSSGIASRYRFKPQDWKKGFSASARHNEPLADLFIKFIERCQRENLTPRSQRFYKEKIPAMIDFFTKRGHKLWQDVNQKDIEDWVRHTQTRDLTDSTKQSWVRATKTFLRWMTTRGFEGYLEVMPVLKQLQGRQYIPSPQTMTAFLKSIDQSTVWGFRDYVVCVTIIDCGARIGEVCELHPEDILWDQGMIRLFGKGRKERFVPASADELFPLLKKWLAVREGYATGNGLDKLFITRSGGQCDRNTFDQAFRKQRIRSSIGYEAQGSITPHTLRHYFGTMYLVNGGKVEVLQKIMGHEEITTTMVYYHHAQRIKTMKTEHTQVSPLKTLFSGETAEAPKKRRKMS